MEEQRLKPDPGNPGDYILERNQTAWVTVGKFGVHLKHSPDGLIVEVCCQHCGDIVVDDWALDWDAACHYDECPQCHAATDITQLDDHGVCRECMQENYEYTYSDQESQGG